MSIQIDKDLEAIINQNYRIDASVLIEIEQNNQRVEAARNSVKQVINSSPKLLEPPVETDSTITNIEQDLEYQYTLKKRELDGTLDLLAQIDVKIDKIDVEIQKIDRIAIILVDEINAQIDKVKAAYEFRVAAGCVSDLEWIQYSLPEEYSYVSGNTNSLIYYVVEKSPAQRIENNYYGIKYYQKPLNRDYGFNVILEFDGTIQVGISSLAVLTPNTIDNIQIGDKIADNVDSPQIFGLGEFATVVGFGSTDVLGVTTSILGTVSIGSTIIAASGIGSTENIQIGNYVVNEDLFTLDTKVVGFGTTAITITYNNPSIPAFVTESVVVPSVLVDKVSIGFATDKVIGFGTYTNYPCVNLDLESNSNISNETFTVIRMTEDISVDFDYTKSPSSPIKIGIENSNQIGLGHSAVLVNNGESSKTRNWKQALGDKEPKVGNNKATYYVGICSWPCLNNPTYPGFTEIIYAQEGQIHKYDSLGFVNYTNISPTGIQTDGALCVSYASSITTEEGILETIKLKNLGKINQLVAASNALRKTRDNYEVRAWGYLQAAAYTRMQLDEISKNLNAIRSVDYGAI